MYLEFKNPLDARINGGRVDLLKDLEKVTYEKDFLRTSLLFKCTKIYIVEWTETTEAFIRYNTKFFPYQLRGDAFKLAREKDVNVQVRDIKRWAVDMSDEEFERFATHYGNYELAIDVRKALKGAQ